MSKNPPWEPDRSTCSRCQTPFTFIRRRHHCRLCGLCVCHACSPQKVDRGSSGSVRVCTACVAAARAKAEDAFKRWNEDTQTKFVLQDQRRISEEKRIAERKRQEEERKKLNDELPRRCENAWCGLTFPSREYLEHARRCAGRCPTVCFKCGTEMTRDALLQHRPQCNPTFCKQCGDFALPRLMKYCPLQLQSAKYTDAISVKSWSVMWLLHLKKFPTGSSDRAAAKIVHCYRYVRIRVAFLDVIFRLILNSLDQARESLIMGAPRSPKSPMPQMKCVADYVCISNDDSSIPSSTMSNTDSITSSSFQNLPGNDRGKHENDIPEGHYFQDGPITIATVKQMIGDYSNGARLPYAAAWRIVEECLPLIQASRNIEHVSVPQGSRTVDGRWMLGGKVVVVGDLHGQLHDLLYILRDTGLPGPDKSLIYVFNGDFVDRGANSVEILLLIYAMKIACPADVFVNRGNHEVWYMNEDYGFDQEVATKYDRHLYKLIQKSFNSLPIAVCISHSVFVVHGGLPRVPGVLLHDIDAIDRHRPLPPLSEDSPEEDIMFQDLLWSDPCEEPGVGRNDRGAGCLFGPDITAEFLTKNQLKFIIRSHEPVMDGYSLVHGGRLATIFSASDYQGEDSNKASYAVITSTDPDNPTFHVYKSRDLHTLLTSQDTEGYALRQSSAQDKVLRHIREKVFMKRHELLFLFTVQDYTKKGTVWKGEWVEAMRNALSIVDVPWFFLRRYVAEHEVGTGRINYHQFLWRYQNNLMRRWFKRMVEESMVLKKDFQAAPVLTSKKDKGKKSNLKDEFIRHVGKSTDITDVEFDQALRQMGVTQLRDQEMFLLFQYYDKNWDGLVNAVDIDYDITDDVLWKLEVMQQLQRVFISGRIGLERVFRMMDADRSGRLDLPQFLKGLTMLNRSLYLPLSPEQGKILYECVDMDQDGIVSFEDFEESFCVVDTTVPAS